MALTDWSQELKFLAEKEARVFQTLDPALLNDRQLKRWFQISRADIRSTGLTFLNRFTSAANTDEIAADTPIYYVDNPLADNKVFPGRWRIVTVEEMKDPINPEEQGIVQTLRKGFLQTVLSEGNVDWTEARLITDRKAPTEVKVGSVNTADSIRVFFVQFRNCDPGKMQSIISEISAQTYTNPVIRSETKTGTFYLAHASTKIEEDGSGTLDLMLADPDFTLTSFEQLGTPKESDLVYVWGVPAATAQDTLDAYKVLGITGSRVTCSQNIEGNTVDMVFRKLTRLTWTSVSGLVESWSCSSKAVVTGYLGLTDDEVAQIMAAIEEPADGVKYKVDFRFDKEEGLWDVWITTITRSEQHVEEYISWREEGEERKSEAKLGVVGDSDDVLPVDFPVQVGFSQKRQVEKNDDCSINVQLDTTEDKHQSIDEYTSFRSKQRHTQTKENLKWASVGRDGNVLSPAMARLASATDGEIKRLQLKKRPSGVLDITEETEVFDTIENAIQYEHRDDDEVSGVTQEDLNIHKPESGLAVDLEPLAGQRMTAEVQYNPDSNTLNVTKRTDSAKEMQGSQGDATPLLVRSRVETTHDTAAIALPSSASAGTRRTVSNTPEPFVDRVTTSVEDTTAVALQKSGSVGGTVLETVAVVLDRNASSVNVAAGTRGKRVTARADVTELGLLDITKTTETAIMDTVGPSNAGGTPYRQDALTLIENADTSTLSYTKPDAGTITRVSAAINPFGLLNITKEDQTVLDRSLTSYEDGFLRDVETVVHTEAETELTAPTAAAGQRVQHQNVPTEFGRTRTVVETETVTDVPVTNYLKSAAETQSVVIHNAVADVEGDPTRAAGTIVEVRNDPTDYVNRYATQKVTRTAVYQSGSYNYLDDNGTVYVWWGSNATAADYASVIAAAALDSTTSNSVEKRENAFGLIDYTIVKQPRAGTKDTVDVAWTPVEYHKYKREQTMIDGVPYYRELDYLFNDQAKLCNYSQAAAEFSGGRYLFGDGLSSITPHGWLGGFFYWRIIRVTLTVGGWTEDSAGL